MAEADQPIPYPLPEPASLHHPGPELAKLRESCPVAAVALPDGSRAWLVTGFEEARAVVTDPRFSRVQPSDGAPSPLEEFTSESTSGMDPPRHTRLKRVVTSTFTPRRCEDLRPRVAEIVAELVDGMTARPQPVDFVENFALPLPTRVICELLGVPLEDASRLHEWSQYTIVGADPAAALSGFRSIRGYFAALVEAKRREPGEDLICALIARRDGEDALSEPELVAMCSDLYTAGHEASVTFLSLIALELGARPELGERLRAEPELVPGAVEELLRFVQVSGDGVTFPRFSTEDVELAGAVIPAGATVLPAYGAADRDPRRYADPDELDPARDPQHLAFGAGPHHCLGAALARVELQEAVRALVTRLPGLRLAVPEAELRQRPGSPIRSFQAMPVSW